MSPRGHPQAVVIAGPHGAGKTSAAPDLLRDAVGIEAFVNADVIAQGLAGFSPQSAAFEAGRVMLRRLRELASERGDLAFESTLAGRSAHGLLTDLVGLGYSVLGDRPAIAHGSGAEEPVVVDMERWEKIRGQIVEAR